MHALETKEFSIVEFFSKAELEKLSDYEIKRYMNMRKNYEIMVAVGMWYSQTVGGVPIILSSR